MGVKYILSQDPSGYGQAARVDVAALFVAGVHVTVEGIKQMGESTDYGLTGDIVNRLKDRDIPYNISIIHLTPDIIPDYKQEGIYTISRLFWETSKLPEEWIAPLNSVDEIWTASAQMADMIEKSGVKVPIYYFPQPINIIAAYDKPKPFQTNRDKDFTFYSIFQWILRKNPRVLLRAYWQEFTGNEQVTLLLKTYRVGYIKTQYEIIREELLGWKRELPLEHFPKIYLVHKVLTDDQMMRLHAMGDCFINPSSGEGWCRPMQEAMLLGKPVVSGDNGGITDIMDQKYYWKVVSDSVQTQQTTWIPYYTSDMQWKELDEDSLRRQMRIVYENDILDIKAKKAQEFVIENFSFQEVGKQMKARIERIQKLL